MEWDGGGYGAAEQGMHPVIFQLYVSIMVLVLTPIILLWEGPFVFTWCVHLPRILPCERAKLPPARRPGRSRRQFLNARLFRTLV